MRKLALSFSLLLTSITVWAGQSDQMRTVMLNATQKTLSSKLSTHHYPIVYGGQDISRSRIATADVNVWSGQPVLIG